MKKIFSYSKPIIAITLALFLLGSIAMVSPKISAGVAEVEPSISVTSIQDDVTIYYPEFNFSCPTNPLFSPVTISGEGVGSAPPGQIQQYHVQINWGDGTVEDANSTFIPSSGHDDFSYTFVAGPHSYDNGNYALTALLYHAEVPGQDNQIASEISIPICVVTEPPILNVVKHVVNNDEGSLLALNFNIHVKIDGQEAPTSPQLGSETGIEYILAPGTYVVSEDEISGYTQTFSGDCDSQGNITLISGDYKTCTLINDATEMVVGQNGVHVQKHVGEVYKQEPAQIQNLNTAVLIVKAMIKEHVMSGIVPEVVRLHVVMRGAQCLMDRVVFLLVMQLLLVL